MFKATLKLKRLRYRRKHAADARADSPRFDLKMNAAKAGAFTVSVAMRFWVCGKRTCRPVRDSRVLLVQVKDPVPASQPTTKTETKTEKTKPKTKAEKKPNAKP